MIMVKNNKGEIIHSKPEYNNPPKGFNGLYVKGPEIYVIPNSKQVYPMFIGKVFFLNNF